MANVIPIRSGCSCLDCKRRLTNPVSVFLKRGGTCMKKYVALVSDKKAMAQLLEQRIGGAA